MDIIQPKSLETKRGLNQDRLAFFETIRITSIDDIDTDFDEKSVESLISEICGTKLFLLGETHGVKENVNIIYTLFKKFGFKNLALEWNKEVGEQAENFLLTKEFDFEVIKDSPDGRITAEHFALLKCLKDEGLLETLVCFDRSVPAADWDTRDASMAQNILANITENLTLVVSGNLHTKVQPITFGHEDEVHHPMGEIVKEQIPNVPSGEIQYHNGQFHNYGPRKFTRGPEGVELQKARFYKSDSGIYVFDLPRAHAAVVPNPSESLPTTDEHPKASI